MSDEKVSSPAPPPEPVAQRESHESFLARIEAALHALPNPSHFADWLKQELVKFRA